ncbi:MAG: hypothetical protein J7J20_04830 [Desulfurococcales archaeon]|nr:hypothetical protein [Desulfurococcales archaeon]
MGYEYSKLKNRLVGATRKFLQSLTTAQYVVANVALSKRGRVDCSVRYGRTSIAFRFKVPEGAFDINDLVVLCIESSRTRFRFLEGTFSFIIFAAIIAAWYMIPPTAPDFVRIVVPALIIALGSIISAISRVRSAISMKRLKSLKEQYRILTVTDGMSSNAYEMFSEIVSDLLLSARTRGTAALRSGDVMEMIRKKYPQLLGVLGIIEVGKTAKPIK